MIILLQEWCSSHSSASRDSSCNVTEWCSNTSRSRGADAVTTFTCGYLQPLLPQFWNCIANTNTSTNEYNCIISGGILSKCPLNVSLASLHCFCGDFVFPASIHCVFQDRQHFFLSFILAWNPSCCHKGCAFLAAAWLSQSLQMLQLIQEKHSSTPEIQYLKQRIPKIILIYWNGDPV